MHCLCVVLQTCLILLEENISEQANTQFKERKDMTCSDGFIQLATKHVYLEGMSQLVDHTFKFCAEVFLFPHFIFISFFLLIFVYFFFY